LQNVTIVVLFFTTALVLLGSLNSAHAGPFEFDCFDGVDNDNDSLIDFADPDCGGIGGGGGGLIPPDGAMPVGGEMFPVDTTALLLAATYSTASWMIPLMIAAVGFGIIITRQKSKLKQNSCPSCKLETEDFFELGDKVVSKCDNPKCRVNLFFIRRYRNSFN